MKTVANKNGANNQSDGILNLPPEVLLHCFSFLNSAKDLVSLSKTCHQLHNLALDSGLWQKFQGRRQLIQPECTHIARTHRYFSAVVVLSDDYILCSDSEYIYILDTANFIEVAAVRVRKPRETHRVHALAVLSNGRFASAHGNGVIQIWEINIKKSFTRKRSSKILRNKLKIKRVREIKVLTCSSYSGSCGVTTLTALPNGQLVSGGCCRHGICIWDVDTGKCLQTLPTDSSVSAIALLHDGKLACGIGGERQTSSEPILVWDLKSGKCIQKLKRRTHRGWLGKVYAITPLQDGLLACVRLYEIEIWNSAYECIKILGSKELEQINALVELPKAYICGWDPWVGTIKIWDLISGKCVQTHSIQKSVSSPYGSFVVLNDGRLLVDCIGVDVIYAFRFPTIPENRLAPLAKNTAKPFSHECRLM